MEEDFFFAAIQRSMEKSGVVGIRIDFPEKFSGDWKRGRAIGIVSRKEVAFHPLQVVWSRLA
jgi:hypothetical protein